MTVPAEQNRRVIVVGAGPAGMLAACRAAENGAQVRLYEKNDRVGRKLAITGKGRCNLTNNCDVTAVLEATRRNPRFLQSALHAFPPSAVMELFESLGCPLKTERGGRVFPVSDRAADVVGALRRYLTRCNVELIHETVTGLWLSEDRSLCRGIKTAGGEAEADCVILACGGLSYPATGSTGDGYRFAKEAGHAVIPPAPSLVPIECEEADCAAMAGLAPKNTALSVTVGQDKKTVYTDFGEMLFTHFGVSGPMILSASAHLEAKDMPLLVLHLDFKPALDEKTLDARILSDFSENKNRDFQNSLGALLPRALIEPIVRRSGIPPHQKVHQITREQRLALCRLIKDFTLHPTRFRPIEEAIVTRGGVDTRQINPRTMASRLCKGLYFAGEMIDVDAYTGGFNLQICFACANAAGKAAALSL